MKKKIVRMDCKFCDNVGVQTDSFTYYCKQCKSRWPIPSKIQETGNLSEEWQTLTRKKQVEM